MQNHHASQTIRRCEALLDEMECRPAPHPTGDPETTRRLMHIYRKVRRMLLWRGAPEHSTRAHSLANRVHKALHH